MVELAFNCLPLWVCCCHVILEAGLDTVFDFCYDRIKWATVMVKGAVLWKMW